MTENHDDNTIVVENEKIDALEVLAEYDRESNTRHFKGIPQKIMRYLAAAFSIYAVWLNTLCLMPLQVRRASFIGLILLMVFLLYPAKKNMSKRVNHIPWYDFVLAIVGCGAFLYHAVLFEQLSHRISMYTTIDLVVAVVGIVILFEACRRVVGIPILFVVAAFIVYAFASGYSLKRIATTLFFGNEGVIGTPLGVCATFIVLFILFAAFLDKTGVGKFFIDIANSIAGWATGGPAKVAVIASALQGMISGSSVANTVGSGSFTIPMMKKTGYKPEFAAAVEAAASTGGQIMPPIMGAAAFLMAEMTGVSYSTIIVAAILPAVLYFSGIFLMVHFEAKKLGLKGLPKEEIPHFGKLFIKKGYLLLPLVVLVVMMTKTTPAMSACFAIVTAIIVSLFRKETRITPKTFVDALENGARNTMGVAVACSIAGIIVGVVTLTGIGLKLAGGLLSLSGGIPIIALFFTMIACIILGMGVPTTANYVIMATITAPIVVQLGVPVLAAHMFVFYFGIVADITPPVALAAYAGSAIAKSNPLKTGINATRLAITAFIIPYIFAFDPSLLLVGADPIDCILILITAFIGMIGMSIGIEGYMMVRVKVIERIVAIGGGLLCIIPGIWTDLGGIALIAIVIAIQFIRRKKHPSEQMA